MFCIPIARWLPKVLICTMRPFRKGFKFPEKLEDWISPAWENFDLRKNPLTPWLTPAMIDKIKNFETVLNGYYPTVTDIRLSNFKRKAMHLIAGIRYNINLHNIHTR